MRSSAGARIWLDELCERDEADPFVALFAESTARAVVTVPRADELRLVELAARHGVPILRIGVVDGSGDDAELDIQGQFTVGLVELRAAYENTLPALFGP
jgi:phosphoribosylformylglycinamidine synthase